MNRTSNKNKIIVRGLKALVIGLELLAFGLAIYLIAMPFYPEIKYRLFNENKKTAAESKDIEKVKEIVEAMVKEPASVRQLADSGVAKEKKERVAGGLPKNEYDVSPNRVIIPKIGVNAPVVESQSASYGLSLGAWHVPESSTPDRGGNMVITGHRFKYLPPSNLTFYLFHKLEAGDIVSVIWEKKKYYYRIREVKIVDKTDVSVLNPTDKSVLTMFTCHPIYSTDQRIVVISDLAEVVDYDY